MPLVGTASPPCSSTTTTRRSAIWSRCGWTQSIEEWVWDDCFERPSTRARTNADSGASPRSPCDTADVGQRDDRDPTQEMIDYQRLYYDLRAQDYMRGQNDRLRAGG